MNGITNMTGMNKVINMKIGNKNKIFFYCQNSIQNHIIMYEITFGFTDRKIDVSTVGFLGTVVSTWRG